jgi:hypothetical protein
VSTEQRVLLAGPFSNYDALATEKSSSCTVKAIALHAKAASSISRLCDLIGAIT